MVRGLDLSSSFNLQKEIYDRTGKVHSSVEEQLRRSFGHGTGFHKSQSLELMAGLITCLC